MGSISNKKTTSEALKLVNKLFLANKTYQITRKTY